MSILAPSLILGAPLDTPALGLLALCLPHLQGLEVR